MSEGTTAPQDGQEAAGAAEISREPADPISDDIPLRAQMSRRQVFDESLVLCAEAIPHRVSPEENGWTISVRESDAARAAAAIAQWESENRPPIEPEKRRWEGQTPAPIFAAICLAGQLATGPRDESLIWFQRGTADAAAIVHGEIWRCATALTLHADLSHALGNLICGYVIIDALARRIGPAWAAWLTLLSGIAGNFLTAVLVRENHLSIGASTSVFGALGALTAAQLISRERSAFLTIGAGVALLAFLGTGTSSDLFAHLFGACSGFALGLIGGALQREAPKKNALQPIFALAALLPLAGAWWLALR